VALFDVYAALIIIFMRTKYLYAVLTLASALFSAAATAAEEIVMPSRGISAHRGASATHPENTLAAFREAVRLGAHQIEFDVRMTKDGHLVLMHDAAVKRTTNGSGLVSRLTLAEIRALDAGSWKGRQFAGERVPTFEETLAMMPINFWLNVHVRDDIQVAEAATREIVRQKRTHQAFLAAGHRAAEAARRIRPDVLICNMERQGDDVRRYAAETIAHGDAFIQILGTKGSIWPDEIGRLKAAKVRVNYFFADKPAILGTLFSAGVDFPLVNDVGPMIDAAQQQGIEPWKPIYRPADNASGR